MNFNILFIDHLGPKKSFSIVILETIEAVNIYAKKIRERGIRWRREKEEEEEEGDI